MAATQYRNAANAFDITLSGSGTPEVSIDYNGAGITFSSLGAAKQGTMHMTASDCVVAIGAVENCAALDQLTSTGSNTATYANAFTATDLVYVLDNNALTYDFVPVKGNADQVIVTVTLDNDYLTAPDRAFPVVIDPTITVSSSETADTCVCENFPTTNYYS